MAVKFAQKTPEAVRGLIREILDTADPNPRLRAAINRLAANEEMEELWSMLPPALRGNEGAMIGEVILAYAQAIGLKQPIKKRLRELSEFWSHRREPITDLAELAAYRNRFRIAPPTYGMIATLARILCNDLIEIPRLERARGAQVWPDDPEMTFERLASTLEAVAAYLDRLDTEAREVEAMLNLPKPPRKRGGTTVQHVYFDQIVKNFFRRESGQPQARIVATLHQVVFDLPDGVAESTVLKR